MKNILVSIMIFLLATLCLTACGSKGSDMSSPTADANTAKFIGEEKAKELALKKAEINESNVRFDRIELDRDDGVWQYELDFRHGDFEYDIDINAETGEILSFDREREEGF